MKALGPIYAGKLSVAAVEARIEGYWRPYHKALATALDDRKLQRGDLVLLQDQDRALWDRDQITEGIAVLERALPRRRPGTYQIQAAIASLHVSRTVPSMA